MTNTVTNFAFPNLFAALKSEHEEQLKKFIDTINEVKELSELKGWYYSDLIPKGKNIKGLSLDELKAYLIKRKQQATEKRIDKDLLRLLTVSNAGEFTGGKISVEWRKSNMWGMLPSGEAWISGNYYKSGSIGGCGYDKLSTAVANCLTQCNELLKAMYLLKEKQPTINNRELFGYGAGYGLLPYFEGGVGVSCYPTIFEKLGFKFNSIASGKTFDVFTIEAN